jgi:predicted metalloprotease with PDZ domain
VHEFAKNVFDVHAFDGKGTELKPVRPNPYQWNVAGHDGTVRIVYKVFGNHVDGTYLAVDDSHAHLNMPATLMWARGFDMRPVRVTFQPPPQTSWKAATQLFATDDPWTFTAPNFQYLMDSPTELSDYTLRSFTVKNPDGKVFTIRTAVHHAGEPSAIDEYAAGAEKIVNEEAAVFGEFPDFDTGTYTFLGDYVPWGGETAWNIATARWWRPRPPSRTRRRSGMRSAPSLTNSFIAGTSNASVRKRSNPSTSKRPTSPVSCGSRKDSRSTTAR